jgi:mono/diheme cytochrome c family protein
MMKMEKARRIIEEVVVKGSPASSWMRRAVIAGLLLAGSATAALAADPAAGEKVFKAQCGICHAVAAGENRIGPTLFGVVGRPAAFQASTTPPTTRSSASPGTPPISTNISPILARWCQIRRWSTPA